MLVAKSFNETDISSLIAVGGQDAKESLTAIENLSTLTESTDKAVVDQRLLKNLLKMTNMSPTHKTPCKINKKSLTLRAERISMPESPAASGAAAVSGATSPSSMFYVIWSRSDR